MGVTSFRLKESPAVLIRATTSSCEDHLTSLSLMATMKSPSLTPPNCKKASAGEFWAFCRRTSASELDSTRATMTGASPLTEKPNPSVVRPRCNWTNLGAVQWRLAEKIAMGPRARNKSFTLYWAKSGGVRASWNFVAAARDRCSDCNFDFGGRGTLHLGRVQDVAEVVLVLIVGVSLQGGFVGGAQHRRQSLLAAELAAHSM
jgi:hypothetical protein